jgi:L-ascorbate metabolism protein UlaG (beta-lactamase superfamily)
VGSMQANTLNNGGVTAAKIIEKEWDETILLEDGFLIHTTTARHFSGRTFKRHTSLWMSYVLQTPSMKVFIGGDSGYDTHFEKTGAAFGPFDVAILECGQYDKSWRYIHSMADEIISIAKELQAQKVMPVHWGKFQLGDHAWDEPIIAITKLAAENNIPLVTPMIGEVVYLKNKNQPFSKWWMNIS